MTHFETNILGYRHDQVLKFSEVYLLEKKIAGVIFIFVNVSKNQFLICKLYTSHKTQILESSSIIS